MQEAPKILAISKALEAPAGQFASYSLVCTGAVVAAVLAAARQAQAAIKVASVAFVLHIFFANVFIWKCGTSLLHAINRSLQNHRPSKTSTTTVLAGKENHGTVVTGGRQRSPELLAAKKKLYVAMVFCLVLSAQTMAILLFAVINKRGSDAPLIWFGVPMVHILLCQNVLPILQYGF